MSYILLLLVIFINNQLLSSEFPLITQIPHIVPGEIIYQYPYIKDIDEMIRIEMNSDEIYKLGILKNLSECLLVTDFTDLSADSEKNFKDLNFNGNISFVPIERDYGRPCRYAGIGSKSRIFFYSLIKDFIHNESFKVSLHNVLSYGSGSGEGEFRILHDFIKNKKIETCNNITFIEPRVFIDPNLKTIERPTLLNLCVYLLQRISPCANFFVERQLLENNENSEKIDLFVSIDTLFQKNDYKKIVSCLHDSSSFFWLRCDGIIFIFNFNNKKCNYAAVSHNDYVYTFNNLNIDFFSIDKKSLSSPDNTLNNIDGNIDAINNTELGLFLNSFFDDLQNSTKEEFIRATAFKLSNIYENIFVKNNICY